MRQLTLLRETQDRFGAKLWNARAWSRPVKTLTELRNVMTYVARNAIKEGLFRHEDTYYLLDGVLQ